MAGKHTSSCCCSHPKHVILELPINSTFPLSTGLLIFLLFISYLLSPQASNPSFPSPISSGSLASYFPGETQVVRRECLQKHSPICKWPMYWNLPSCDNGTTSHAPTRRKPSAAYTSSSSLPNRIIPQTPPSFPYIIIFPLYWIISKSTLLRRKKFSWTLLGSPGCSKN